jgi:RluA family pseudouridine synthase
MIEVLFEHPWFLVINKPSGILTQAVPGIDSVQTLLVEQLWAQDRSAPTPFIGMPHRLDRVTSGAMIVARNQRALKRLSDQFATRVVRKLYRALVPIVPDVSEPVEEETLWRDTMRKVENEARAELVSPDAEGAKEAILRFREISRHEIPASESANAADANPSVMPVRLVEIELETGRMHQIRLQFSARKQPIVGDVLYGSPYRWLGFEPGERESPIALHAHSIGFRNPQNGEQINIEAPYPQGWPVS